MKKFKDKNEIIKEAKKYKNAKEWQNKSSRSYHAALKISKSFFKECKKHMLPINHVWTKQEIMQEALKYEYSSDWYNKSPTTYVAAYKKFGTNFAKKCKKHMTRKDRRFWSKDKVLQEALKYNQISHWRKKSDSSYAAARAFGKTFYKRCIKHMKKDFKKWTKNSILKEALKFATFKDWGKHSQKSVTEAKKYGTSFFKKCLKHMKNEDRSIHQSWTRSRVLKEAKKYNIKQEWKKASYHSFSLAKKYGNSFFKKCLKHMKKKQRWNQSKILKSAQKYKSFLEWRINDHPAYVASCKENQEFRTLCKKHMIKLKDSYGEELIGRIFTFLFKKRFKKVKFKKIGEIDRFAIITQRNKQYSIGIEHQGAFHYKFMPYYHKTIERFERRLFLDRKKKRVSKQHNIKLLCIKDLRYYYKLDKTKIHNKIQNFLMINSIPYSKRRLKKAILRFI